MNNNNNKFTEENFNGSYEISILLPFPVSLSIPKHTKEEVEGGAFMPYIFGGKLKNEYEFEGLHFHWGDKNNRGSEHVLNDIRFPMEMHIIHRNKKYANVSEALEHPDGLTVLAFFYQVSNFSGAA